MEILDCLRDQQQWQLFYEYKLSCNNLPDWMLKQLREYIDNQRYLPVADRIDAGLGFSHPKKSAISKMHSEKKRIVYTYSPDENWVLKLMTHLLIRKYDHLFTDNLYSFRAGRSVKDAIRDLRRVKDIDKMWSYKADIRNYFNSIPVDQLLPVMEDALKDEPALFRFLTELLTSPYVTEQGQVADDPQKGIMAGTPFSTFLANLYLCDLDRLFCEEDRIYARYSDDIILFSPTQEALEQDIQRIHDHLNSKGLTMNPAKESIVPPGEMWTFLGFSFHKGIIDIAPASIEKIKGKMRRKTRALSRWRDRKGHEGTHAARAFIKTFNRKLLEHSPEHDLSWALWYFPTINTSRSLQIIDRYAQQCIRTLATGKHTKSAYNFRYEDIKKLGYVSLVNRYYSHTEQKSKESKE